MFNLYSFSQLCLSNKSVKKCKVLCLVVIVDESDSDTDMPRGRVLAAALHLIPGYFSCDCIWQTHFVLHSRLKITSTSAPRSSISPGQHLYIVELFC